MTLRSRFTLLYTLLLGGLQLVLGVVLYQVISGTILQQVDDVLLDTSQRVVRYINAQAAQPLTAASFEALEQELETERTGISSIQLWGASEALIWAWPRRIGPLVKPLSRSALYANRSEFTSVTLNGERLRVLSLILRRGGEPFGVLQIGLGLTFLEKLRSSVLRILLLWSVTTALGAGLIVWFATQRLLAPVESVTRVALQITRADDLSRRIPPYGLPPNDEIGQLIMAFNQTLERLERLFLVQRRFLADVSHELRTPLTVIKGNVALLRRLPGQDLESLDSIENEVDRLTRLVGDLLVLSRAESGNLPLTRARTELDALVLEVIGELQVLAKDHVQLEIGEFDQVQVCADRDRLKQVLVNLVGNALRYTPPGGRVRVNIGKSGKQAHLSVQDSGPGIAPEDLPHIFERFYRAEKARTRGKDGQGFGLGLSIAYWIVRAHGGRIEVDSRPGEGTTFHIWLPLSHPDCAT